MTSVQPIGDCLLLANLGFGIDVIDVTVDNLFPPAGAPFNISATIRIAGMNMQGFKNSNAALNVNFYFESFGGGPEGLLSTANVPAGAAAWAASATCVGAEEVVLTANPNAPAVQEMYKLTAVLSDTGNSGWAINAYAEGPLISVT